MATNLDLLLEKIERKGGLLQGYSDHYGDVYSDYGDRYFLRDSRDAKAMYYPDHYGDSYSDYGDRYFLRDSRDARPIVVPQVQYSLRIFEVFEELSRSYRL